MGTAFRSSRTREELATVLRSTDGWITVADAAIALGLDRKSAAKRLARWTEQGWLRRIQRGHYAPIPLERQHPEAPLEEPWAVVPHLLPDGYVGGWTAAHHWDLTEQVFRDVCVFAPGRSRRVDRAGSTFVVFPAPGERSFGMRTHWVGSAKVLVSDPERTLVDMLDTPRAGPGIQQVVDCLENYARSSTAHFERLVDYAGRIGNGAVFKRLGFLLEEGHHATPEILAICRRSLTKGLAKLDPAIHCPHIVSRWRLRLPVSWVDRRGD